MRTLHADLTAAQRSRGPRRPYHKVVVQDRFGGIRRLRPETWYSGAEAAGPHAAACPSDDSLNRLRIDGTTLYRQRVTSPDSGDTYSGWTSFRTGTRLCAIAAYGANLVAFAVDNGTPTQVYTATSADSGATWSAFALAFTHAVTITAIAACAKSDGTLGVVLNNGNNLSIRLYTGGAWAAAVTTTDGLITPSGVAVFHHGDYNVIVTGAIVSGGGSRLDTRIFSDGFAAPAGSWFDADSIAETAPSSAIAYSAPFADRVDTYHATARETFTGTGAYDRIIRTYAPATADFSFGLWREPVPFNLDHDYGLALADNTTHVFLCTPARVYAMLKTVVTLDVTADVLSVDAHEGLFDTRECTIRIANAGDTYDAPPEPITKGAEVRVAAGYQTASGAKSSEGPYYWIESIERDYDSNPHALVLHCRPVWWWLSRWRAPRAFIHVNRTPFNALQQIAASSGFEFDSVGTSTAGSTAVPLQVIPPGLDGLTALRRIMARLPDRMFSRAHFLLLTEPAAADTADADYERTPSSAQQIVGARYLDRIKEAAHVRITAGAAADILGETIDYTEAELAYTSPALYDDRDLTTAAAALVRAQSVTRALDIERTVRPFPPGGGTPGAASPGDPPAASDAVLRTPVHCGLETDDVIAVTDARAGLSAVTMRVLGISTVYDRNKRVYDHVLALGAP